MSIRVIAKWSHCAPIFHIQTHESHTQFVDYIVDCKTQTQHPKTTLSKLTLGLFMGIKGIMLPKTLLNTKCMQWLYMIYKTHSIFIYRKNCEIDQLAFIFDDTRDSSITLTSYIYNRFHVLNRFHNFNNIHKTFHKQLITISDVKFDKTKY